MTKIPGALGLPPEQVAELLTAAGRAPSLHNTQPWRFHLAPHVIELYADPGRRLPVGDRPPCRHPHPGEFIVPTPSDPHAITGAAQQRLTERAATSAWPSRQTVQRRATPCTVTADSTMP